MRSGLMAAALAGGLATGSAAQTCQEVRFNPGESGAFIDGIVQPEQRNCYSMSVRKGQKVFIGRVGGDKNVAITVIDVGDARESFEFAAPSSRVEFLVFQLFRSATPSDYSLHIQVP